MEAKPKLFMVVLGATPPGRLTEQHDVFFGIGYSLAQLVPKMQAFWPEAKGRIHIDSWREVTMVDGYEIAVVSAPAPSAQKLFFINLGGYKPGELEEYHYKTLSVANTMAEAVKQSKKTHFYKHYGFKGAESHVDDKFGLDADDVHQVDEVAHADVAFHLQCTPKDGLTEDWLHIGYLKIEKLLKS